MLGMEDEICTLGTNLVSPKLGFHVVRDFACYLRLGLSKNKRKAVIASGREYLMLGGAPNTPSSLWLSAIAPGCV